MGVQTALPYGSDVVVSPLLMHTIITRGRLGFLYGIAIGLGHYLTHNVVTLVFRGGVSKRHRRATQWTRCLFHPCAEAELLRGRAENIQSDSVERVALSMVLICSYIAG